MRDYERRRARRQQDRLKAYLERKRFASAASNERARERRQKQRARDRVLLLIGMCLALAALIGWAWLRQQGII